MTVKTEVSERAGCRLGDLQRVGEQLETALQR